MTNEELLLAMSTMMDTKLRAELQPLKNQIQDMQNEIHNMQNEIHNVKLFQENVIMPQLNTIQSCYLDTYHRYRDNADRMDAAYEDIDILKKVIAQHSEKLQAIS